MIQIKNWLHHRVFLTSKYKLKKQLESKFASIKSIFFLNPFIIFSLIFKILNYLNDNGI